jgi:hypothetical protein
MKLKRSTRSAVLLPLAAATLLFSMGAPALAAQIQPPPKPEVVTVIEPGDAQRKEYHLAHKHHHKGHIKKDKFGKNEKKDKKDKPYAKK